MRIFGVLCNIFSTTMWNGKHSSLDWFTKWRDAPVFKDAVAKVQQSSLAGRRTHRPKQSSGKPSFLVKQPVGSNLSDSVVACEHDIKQHLFDALSRTHPFDKPDNSIPADLAAAIDKVCEYPGDIAEWRAHQLELLKAVSLQVQELTSELRAKQRPHVKHIAGHVDLGLMAVLVDALEWPDFDLVRNFVFGFHIVGDIPDSGLFVHIPPHQRNPAFAQVKGSAFYDAIESGAQWTSRLRDEAATKFAEKGASEEDKQLWFKTMEEVGKGLMIGPYTRAQLDQKFGYGNWRPIPRFGVWQKGKLRGCDDARRSLHNLATRMEEALACDTSDFPIRVARKFIHKLGLVRILLGTEDMASAYRKVPCADPNLNVVSLMDPESGVLKFFLVPGCNFGLKAAVVAFNRVPEFMVHVARRLLASCVSHFFDDYPVCEPAWSAKSSQLFLGLLHEIMGLPFSLEKHFLADSTADYLGIQNDFSTVHVDGHVKVRMTPSRRETLDAIISKALKDDSLSPAEASSLHGKLQFAMSASFGKIGRSALVMLRDREVSETPPFNLSKVLRQSLSFLKQLVLEVPDFRMCILPRVEDPALVWSDAMFNPASEAGELSCKIGFVIYCPVLRRYFHSAMDVSSHILALFKARKNYIGQAEVLGALAVYLSVESFDGDLAGLLSGRRVLHFIDNQGALANCISCSSKDDDCAWMVHRLAISTARMACSPWFDYVRSKANIADLPSRWEFELLESMGSTWVETRIPASNDWSSTFH